MPFELTTPKRTQLNTTGTMETASASWADELSRTRAEFSAIKRRLTKIVSALEAEQQHTDGGGNRQPIPDPVRLLERISALESSMDQLEADCQNVCGKRQVLARETADALLRNARLIQELSARTGCDIGDDSVDGEQSGRGMPTASGQFWTEDLAELARQRDALSMPASSSDNDAGR